MTSAWDITEAVVPPRSVFFHAPLGHTTGRPDDAEGQYRIVKSALEAGRRAEPGEIIPLAKRWPEDAGWEDRAYTPEHTATSAEGSRFETRADFAPPDRPAAWWPNHHRSANSVENAEVILGMRIGRLFYLHRPPPTIA